MKTIRTIAFPSLLQKIRAIALASVLGLLLICPLHSTPRKQAPPANTQEAGSQPICSGLVVVENLIC